MRALISVGEASGDRLGAELLDALKDLRPELAWHGVAGPALRERGVQAVVDMESIAVMGFIEIIAQWRPILAARRAIREALREGGCVLVLIDAPAFNLPLAELAQELGIPVVFFGSPQVWAWKKHRARRIAQLARSILCLLPFEPPYYEAHQGPARFIGHPVLERCPFRELEGEDWAILPGSRRSELRRLLPDFLDTVTLLRQRQPGARVRLPVAPGLRREDLEQAAAGRDLDQVELVGSLEEAALPARACLAASGTAVLELACMGRPVTMAYRMHPITWHLARLLVRGIDYASLPNLILDRPLVPEHLQHFSPEGLCDSLLQVAEGGQLEGFRALREELGAGGATRRAAECVHEILPATPLLEGAS